MDQAVQRPSLLKPMLIWASVITAIHVLMRVQNANAFLFQIAGALTAVVLVYPPALLSFYERKQLAYWQLNKDIALQDLKWFAIVSLIVFPLVILGNHFYQKFFFNASYLASDKMLWMSYSLTQVLLIAFPEEFFFRGYLQGEFVKRFPNQRKIFGAPFGLAQILTSLVFALSHSLIAVQWWHIFIFFPSLIFAWLKEKTGRIWAGALFHAACNIFAYWAAMNYKKF